jgi:hypothetical protein
MAHRSMEKIRIATWNLDHASKKTRPIEKQIGKILDINPDIIILTETCDEVDSSNHGYHSAKTHKNCYGKYCSVIWSKYQISSAIPTYDPEIAVCARIKLNAGYILAYGTIITYAGDKGIDGKSKYWEEHYKEIARQGEDWERILKANPGIPLCVAGDFNQTREAASEPMARQTPDPQKGWARNNIVHICLSRTGYKVLGSWAWDHFTSDGAYLSDHNGVCVDISFRKVQ